MHVKNVIFDTEHRVIQFMCNAKNLDKYYLSGSPLISHNKDGSRSILGIVSGSIRANGGSQTNVLFACPINMVFTKEIQP